MTDSAPYLNLRLKPAEVLRLQAGDIVLLNIPRPIAESEQQRIVDAWTGVMQRAGKANELVLMCGESINIKVVPSGLTR